MAVKIEKKDGYTLVHNEKGPTLGYSENSGVRIIEEDGCAFKNLSKDGVLKPYEDWRLSYDERAKDLASRLSVEQIAGLMLYSIHQIIPTPDVAPAHREGTYGSKPFSESGAKPWALTDQQKAFLENDFLRHVLVTRVKDTETAARWSNAAQAFVEALPLGVPANNSSDPRHGCYNDAEFNAGAGGDISHWPEGPGMAATFDPELNRRFARVAAEEYRALGITTALSPQIDAATEPRWYRYPYTFSESFKMATEMAESYCDGMQQSPPDKAVEGGWGYGSVNAMCKHWPGGGSGEGGRDSHYAYGKYNVYPGGKFEEHMKPFTEGAFALKGETGKAAAVMPYYAVSYNQDPCGKNVGNSYSTYIIKDLLREKHAYDGVVCTDWSITGVHGPIGSFDSRCWGVEDLSEVEQHLLLIMNGVDQFGGNNKAQPIIEGYAIGCERYGEEAMRKRMEESAVRLLRNIFHCGLFENPYLDVEESMRVVGCPEYMAEGYAAQLKAVVLLKNQGGVLPVRGKKRVYVPKRHIEPYYDFFRLKTRPVDVEPVQRALLEEYFDVVDTPEEADLALVFISSPITDCYTDEDVAAGGNGYLPVSLQYRPYTATTAREVSIAGGDPLESFTNRSYKGKTVKAANESDLDNVIETKKRMGEKPVVVCLTMKNPTIVAEFEPYADAIIADLLVQHRAILDIVTGKAEPSALLPMQLPKDMETVEAQCEDVPLDMECYTDACGNRYDFGFGLNFSGVLDDGPAKKYR